MSARLLFLVIVSAFAAAWLPDAGADPVTDLFAANVPVADQSAEARTVVLRDAMAQVLVKITGSQAVLETDEGRDLVESAPRFLQQYRYESIRPVPIDPMAPRLALYAEFDGTALERRLRAAGVALWGRERPMTLIWLALSDSTERHLVGSDAQTPIASAVRTAATRRGLPVKLPLLDTEDATRVSFMDVWGVFEEPLLAAAARYSPDAVFAGSVFSAGDDLWAGRFSLLRGDQRHRWELSGPTPEAVAAAAIDALAEHYANEYSLHALGDAGQVTMEIAGVTQLRDYARVQSYLKALSVVKDVHLLGVDGEALRFELDLNSTVQALEQSIALGRVLEPLPAVETVIHLGPVNPADTTIPGATAMPLENAAGVAAASAPAPPVLHYRLRR